jgi:CRP-like cAMP-binding protein
VIGDTGSGILVAARAASDSLAWLPHSSLWASGLLSCQERQAIAEAVSPMKSVGANVDLVGEGAGADALFIIVDGWACRYMTTRAGCRQLTALLVPGDLSNLDSLMFEQLEYGVRTLTQAKVVALPRDRALALVTQHAGIARTFAWLGLVENAILSKSALSLGRRSAFERLAHLLCEISARLGVGRDHKSFCFPLTQEQIADALGLTSVHVNRTLQHLRSDGLVEIANRTMTILDGARLRDVCGFNPRYLHITPPAQLIAQGLG